MFERELPIVGQFGAEDITRGVCRYLWSLGYSPLTEFKLTSNRRVDVMGLNSKGFYIVIEVKSSVADFRSDDKWRDYLPFADQMYFAVANQPPIEKSLTLRDVGHTGKLSQVSKLSKHLNC